MSDNTLQTFSPPSTHFFKIVLTRNLRDRKIRIPKKFMRKYGETLSSPVILKLPSGLEWKVELTSCNGVVWLQKGWPEFVDHLSIRRGHLLLFRYEGNCQFHVIILDTSTTEINYPTGLTHLHNSNYIKIDDDDDHQLQEPKRELEVENDIDYVQISDEDHLPPFPKTEKKSPSQCPRPQKRMRTTSRSDLKSLLPASDRSRACDRARAFKSENPFFWVLMEPSYISHASLHVPKKFAERYINKKEVEFSLRVMDGRSWFVQCRVFKKLNKRGTYDSTAEICNPGWRAFVKDNNVEVGDVCFFELIGNIENHTSVFLVTIDRRANHQSLEMRSNGEKVSGRGRPPSSGAPRTREGFEGRGDKNHSFQVVIREYHMKHSTVSVPIGVVRSSNLVKSSGQYLKLVVGNRYWEVRLVYCKNPIKYVLSQGWRAFSRHNRLCRGDVCRFQMIHSRPSELLVSIQRASIM